MIVKVTVFEGYYSDYYVKTNSETEGMAIIKDAYLNKEITVKEHSFYDFEARRVPDGDFYEIFNEEEK